MMQSARWDRRACPFQSDNQQLTPRCVYCTADLDRVSAPPLRHLVDLLREAIAAAESAVSVGVLSREEAISSPQASWSSLTEAELVIAELIGDALTNQQIARRVVRSPHTVNYHLRQIYRKLGINSRVQLAALVQAHRQARPERPAA
jgi:DNA-binding CsgD family transcriptional regulator